MLTIDCVRGSETVSQLGLVVTSIAAGWSLWVLLLPGRT